MYRVWTEWDLGFDNYVYASRELALADLKKEIEANEILEEGNTFEDLLDDLYGVEEVILRK